MSQTICYKLHRQLHGSHKQLCLFTTNCILAERSVPLLQALNLWLQYLTLLGGINIPTPKSVHWIFCAASFVFATVTSGSLSTDCLLSGPVNTALQRMLIHLAVPGLVFLALSIIQVLR